MHEASVKLLNQAVGDELSAVHQYMYFHFHCDDQGFDLLAGLFKRTAIEEMLHIENIAERILFLKGEVELNAVSAVEKVHDVGKMLNMARGMEEQSILDYNRWANECGANADSVTKKLFGLYIRPFSQRHPAQHHQRLTRRPQIPRWSLKGNAQLPVDACLIVPT